MSILFAGGGTFDILAKVPSETLLNMAAVIDHQFKKHTVLAETHSRSPLPSSLSHELSSPHSDSRFVGKLAFAASVTI